uniref:Uncharacterized protein n=1 Tax=Globisporangium ultimum (strain ATCC 200006 / CBS 805.95 / DAOM BR144) TaxID=431595 RepID=K3WDZ2_GLOUD
GGITPNHKDFPSTDDECYGNNCWKGRRYTHADATAGVLKRSVIFVGVNCLPLELVMILAREYNLLHLSPLFSRAILKPFRLTQFVRSLSLTVVPSLLFQGAGFCKMILHWGACGGMPATQMNTNYCIAVQYISGLWATAFLSAYGFYFARRDANMRDCISMHLEQALKFIASRKLDDEVAVRIRFYYQYMQRT